MKTVCSFLSLTLVSIGFLALAAVPLRGDNDPQTPYIQTVNPEDLKAGAVLTAAGTFLGKTHVSEIFLTRGNTDVKLEITSQQAGQIVAKLPADVTAGRYRLMLLTVGAAPRFIEQPVQVTIQ